MKSAYNERFSFHDPKQSACRSTRYRAAKRKATEWPMPRECDVDNVDSPERNAIMPEWEDDTGDDTGMILQTTVDLAVDCDQESHEPHADPFTNRPTQEERSLMLTELTTASRSPNPCDPELSIADIAEPRLDELNFDDFPQSLEYSSILSTQNDDELADITDKRPSYTF